MIVAVVCLFLYLIVVVGSVSCCFNSLFLQVDLFCVCMHVLCVCWFVCVLCVHVLDLLCCSLLF